MSIKTVELAWFRSDGLEYAGTRSFGEHAGSTVVRISEFTRVDFEMLPEPDLTAALKQQRQASIAYHEAQVALLRRQAE